MNIELPYPHKALWPNGRSHWGTVASQKAKHRQWALLATVVAMGDWQYAGGAIKLTVLVYPKPKGPLPDQDNVVASCKAYFDGIADALGVDDRHFTAPKVEFAAEREGRFVVRVEQ